MTPWRCNSEKGKSDSDFQLDFHSQHQTTGHIEAAQHKEAQEAPYNHHFSPHGNPIHANWVSGAFFWPWHQ